MGGLAADNTPADRPAWAEAGARFTGAMMIRSGLTVLAFALALGATAPTLAQEATYSPDRSATASRSPFEGLNRRLALFTPHRRPPRLEADPPAVETPETPEKAERPDLIGRFLDPINAARMQQRLDEAFGFDSGEKSDKPKAPEIGEPVFFDVVRPLGELKYANEFNYLLNPSTRNAPTLQVLEYEYVFADWNSAELDLSYFNRKLEILTPFYQRTFGVGRDGNWVHGVQLSTDIYVRSKFVGGSAVYALGWKPTAESKFSTLFFVGANRALIGGFSSINVVPPHRPEDRTFGSWRPTFNANLFYKLGEHVTIGIENDLFCHSGKAGEYLVLPFITWEISEHAFLQAGAGYYHFESVDQATFMLHLNFLNQSKRSKASESDAPTGRPGRR